MSVSGIASSILSGLSGSHNGQSRFQQVRNEFKQLAEDLQSGNLSEAQRDFTALSKNLASVGQSGSQTISSTSSTTSTSPLLQAFHQLGQDLQPGNLQAAQQNVQSNAQQAEGHHHLHHRHVESSQEFSSSASVSQQTGAIAQAFRRLAQTLQSGNLQGAQQAFSALQH